MHKQKFYVNVDLNRGNLIIFRGQSRNIVSIAVLGQVIINLSGRIFSIEQYPEVIARQSGDKVRNHWSIDKIANESSL